MTTKQEALEYIKMLATQKIVTKEELDAAFAAGAELKIEAPAKKQFGMTEILYYIGGAIVFLGVAILLGQNWATLGFFTKVAVTLGFSIAAYFAGLIFSRDERSNSISVAFYLISALLAPGGLWIVFNHAGLDASSFGTQSVIAGILFITYLLSYFVLQKNIFIVFSLLFGTWLFFSFTSFIVGSNPSLSQATFNEYRILTAGLSYILLGYTFSQRGHPIIGGVLYNFGIFGFLAAALGLGGFYPHQNVFWELIFPGLVFAVLFLSVYIKSKAFLAWGTFFLMAYIIKITAEYFATGLGWPLALMMAGFAIIAVGYLSLWLKKKYLN